MTDAITTTGPRLGDLLQALPSTTDVPACAPARQAPLTPADIADIVRLMGVDLSEAPFSLADVQLGIEVELEHDRFGHFDEVVKEDLVMSGRVVLEHLQQRPDYYIQITQPHSPGDSVLVEPLDVGAD